MRILKANYEGLQDIDELSLRLRKFLSEPEIQEALQKSEFGTLYKKLQKTENYDTIGNFTQLIISLHIDPLSYLDSMPTAFLAHTPVKSIDIPNHITNISDWAFCDCESLTSITIPNSVTSIGDFAFRGCSGLTSVTIGNSVTSIGDFAFRGCSSLRSITIPSNVTGIGYNVFARCSGLTSVIIPNSVTSISNEAFRGCSGLTNVTIGNRVTRIGYMAFEGCRNLNYIKYMGTIDQWNKIHISSDWNGLSPIKTIHCIDGDIEL